MALDDIQESHNKVRELLESLKTEAKSSGDKFLTDLERFGIEGAQGLKSLSKMATDDLKKSLVHIIKDKGQGKRNFEDFSFDEKIILASYLEAHYGDSYINMNNLDKGVVLTDAKLKDGFNMMLNEYNIRMRTVSDLHTIDIRGVNSIDMLLEKISDVESKEELGALIDIVKQIIGETGGVPTQELLLVLRRHIDLDVFEEYIAAGKAERNIIIALYGMLYLGMQEHSLVEDAILINKVNFIENRFIERVRARLMSKELIEKNSEKTHTIEKILEKDYDEFTQGDLHILNSRGVMGKYFLHNAHSGEMDFDSSDKSIIGKEYVAYFNGNTKLNNFLSLGALLGSIQGEGNIITEIEVIGIDGKPHVARLRYPPEVSKIGFHYVDETYKDGDGDSYVEVYDYTKFKITEINGSKDQEMIQVVKQKEYSDYYKNQQITNEEVRGPEVNEHVRESLILGGLPPFNKISIGEVEAMKQAGIDVSKFFLKYEHGAEISGLDSLEVGSILQFDSKSSHLNRKLSAGLLLAPQIFSDSSQSKNVITEISVNGKEGRLMKVGNKIGFYGTTKRGDRDKKSGFDDNKKGLFYRRIYDGDIIKILETQTIAQYRAGKDSLETGDYELNNEGVSLVGIEGGESKAVYINPLTGNKMDKNLLLRDFDERFEKLGGKYKKYISASINKSSGLYEYVPAKGKKGFSVNPKTGRVYISDDLRRKLMGVDAVTTFGEDAAEIHKQIENGTYSGRFSLPPMITRYNPNIKMGNGKKGMRVTLCGRVTNQYRQKIGLKPIAAHADDMAMTFGPYNHKGGIVKYSPNSQSTVNAVVDGESSAMQYAKSNINDFDSFDIYSKGTGKYSTRFMNKRHKGYIGHVVTGVKIAGRLYVADPYSKESYGGEKMVKKSQDIATGRTLKTITYEQSKLIPFDKYFEKKDIRRVVFHDSPTIDNEEASRTGAENITIPEKGNAKIQYLYNKLSKQLPNKPEGIGFGSTRQNFKKNGMKILQAVYSRCPEGGTPDPILILAQIQQESGFNRTIRSPAGAQGLMQFMPGTWGQYGKGPVTDINANIDAGIRYMKYLTTRFGNMKDVLRAYNWGEGNMGKFIKGKKKRLPQETKKYTKGIMEKYHALKGMGL